MDPLPEHFGLLPSVQRFATSGPHPPQLGWPSTAFNKRTMPRKSTTKSPTFVQSGTRTKSSPKTHSHQSVVRLKPEPYEGLDIGRQVSLATHINNQKIAYIERVRRQNQRRYDHDWGDAIVDQSLSDDPGPINSGSFSPVRRWIVLYRTAESGVDGTHNITVSDVRTAIGSVTSTANSIAFIIRALHIWIAPNTVSTHFGGLLFTKDDADNGILGGRYSDIAPYGEFVKFRVVYRGEGYVASGTDPGTKELIGLGGSEKWNAVVYAEVVTFD